MTEQDSLAAPAETAATDVVVTVADETLEGAAATETEAVPVDIPPEQVMLKGLVILPPRQKSKKQGSHCVPLPALRAEEPVQSLRGALAEVVGYAHITNFRFEVREKPSDLSTETAVPLISPYTGMDAVISVPLAAQSLELGKQDTVPVDVLDEYGNLTKLVDGGWHEKETAFEMVLERYDLASIRDHVHRLRSLLNGSAPAVHSLLEEEEQPEGEARPEESPDKEDQGDKKEESVKEKPKKPLPPLPAYSSSVNENRTVDGTQNLHDFFYLVSGEDPANYGVRSETKDILNKDGNKSAIIKKKKKPSKATKAEKPVDEEEPQDDSTPEESLAKELSEWNELDERAKVPFTIRYSGFHPPPASRRWMGDLAYLELIPGDGGEQSNIANGSNLIVNITATPTGFYVNKSSVSNGKSHFDPSPASKPCFSHTLLDCLLQASEAFRQSWTDALEAVKERATLMKSLNKDTSLSFFRIAVRGDFQGFKTAASAMNSVQQALDSSLSTPSWLIPRPSQYPGADSETSWTGYQFHSYNPARVEEDLAHTHGFDIRNGGIRDWNEELQMAREMPVESLPERIERARLMHKVMTEFGEAALLGVKAISDGHITPMNPNEGARSQVYLHNNIFFSRAVDAGPETFKIAQGDRAARKAANRDIQCIGTLHRSEKAGLYTLATVLIDYLGHRYVCQSILPGILIGEKSHTLLYGAVETGVPLKGDGELQKLLEEVVGDPMMVASRPVFRHPLTEDRMAEIQRLKQASPLFPEFEKKTPPEVVEPNDTMQTCIPVEAKGILGSDQRKYLLDFGRLTPRDANWVPESKGGTGRFESCTVKPKAKIPASLEDDEWTMNVLRPELVSRFTNHCMAKYLQAKRLGEAMKNEEKAENKPGDTLPADESSATETKSPEEPSSSPTTENPSALEGAPENDEKKEDEENKTGLAKEDLNYLATLKLNINVFLPHMRPFDGVNEEAAAQIKLDEEKSREAALFLWDEVLPKINRAIKDGSVQQIPLDGKTLTEYLHRHGVNCRYLGRLATLAREEELRDEQTESDLKQNKLTVVERRTMPKCWLELLECEIVARAAKHVLDSYLTENGGVASTQPAQTVASFLSALVSEQEETAAQTEVRLNKRTASQPDEDEISSLTIRDTGGEISGSPVIRGRGEVWDDIEAEVGRRFRYALTLYNTGNKLSRALYIPLLRRVCQRTGIRILAKNYDVGGKCLCSGGNAVIGHVTESYPISPLDILDVVPLMKHAASYNEGFSPCSVGPSVALPALQVSLRDARLALEKAHIQTNGRALGKGLELAQEAASLYQRVTENAAHPGVIESIELMANIFLEAGDPEMAALNASKALALSIQSGGFDTANVFTCHMTLFQMYYTSRELDRASKHLHAAIYLLEIMAGPRHTENFTAFHKLGSVYSHEDYDGKYLSTALKFLEEATKRESCDRLMDGITAKSLAKVFAGVGDYKDALEAEKKAFGVLSMFLGAEHQLTKESDKELKNYTKLAQEQGTKQVESEKIREEVEKAEAVAAALAAEEEKKRKKNNKKKKTKK